MHNLFQRFSDYARLYFLRRINNQFYQNVFKLSLGTSISQLLLVLSTPIISRIYSPEDYGLQGLILSYTGLFSIAASLGLEVSIVSQENKENADRILLICLLLNFFVAILGGFAIRIFISTDILSYGELPSWSSIPASIIIWAIGSFMALRYWAIRNDYYKTISESLVTQGIGRAITPIIYGVFRNNWLGLLFGEIVGRLLGILKIMKLAIGDLEHVLKTSALLDYYETIRVNWKFIILGLPSSVINSLYSLLPVPFISMIFGNEMSGQFLLVQNILAIPSSLVSSSVADAFHSRLSKEKKANLQSGNFLLIKTVRGLTLLAILIFVPIAVISPFIFENIFGNKWKQAGMMMPYIAMLSMFAFVVSPLSRAIFVYNKQEYKIYVDLFRLTIPFISIFGVKHFGYGFLSSIIVYVILGIIGYIVYYFIIIKACSLEK